jgi:hypothetical protein
MRSGHTTYIEPIAEATGRDRVTGNFEAKKQLPPGQVKIAELNDEYLAGRNNPVICTLMVQHAYHAPITRHHPIAPRSRTLVGLLTGIENFEPSPVATLGQHRPNRLAGHSGRITPSAKQAE